MPLASPPPLPPVSRWMNRARTSEAANPAREDDNAALNSLRDKNPSLFLSREGAVKLSTKGSQKTLYE